MSKGDNYQFITNLTIEHKINSYNLTISEITKNKLLSKKSN